MPPKRKINKRKVVAVNVDDVDQTEDPLPQAETYDDSETAGDDPADNVVTVTGDGAKKPVVTQTKSKNKTPDNEGGTVINIALPEDISKEQELKIAAWVEDNEMLYNQTTKEFKNKAKKDRMFADFGATIGLSVQEGEDDEEEEIEVLDDDDDGASIVSSAVSASAAPQSSHRDSPDIQTMVYGKGKAPCSLTKVRARSSKVCQVNAGFRAVRVPQENSTRNGQHAQRDARLPGCFDTAEDHAAIWGESLAISAQRIPFNLFQRFQMDSLALMNRYLGMAKRGEDPDQIQSQSFMHQLQMAQPQRQYKQQYPQHDNSWPFYTNMAPGPPLLQSSIMSHGTHTFHVHLAKKSNIPNVFEHTIPRDQAAQHQHNSTPSTISSLGANPSSVTSSRNSSLNISSLINTMVDSPYSQDSPMNRQPEGDIE
ncbi:unnamed protein product [Mytilus coruscus]|uniref:Uncharacterized protein n=1 Tax=Mytilus coruscus TaxID=42192 RepID=A0A6J8ENM5_MYTCO|nr:unnamed protein product [Mytilus coruscus]